MNSTKKKGGKNSPNQSNYSYNLNDYYNESNLATLRRVRLKLKRDQDLNNK